MKKKVLYLCYLFLISLGVSCNGDIEDSQTNDDVRVYVAPQIEKTTVNSEMSFVCKVIIIIMIKQISRTNGQVVVVI